MKVAIILNDSGFVSEL